MTSMVLLRICLKYMSVLYDLLLFKRNVLRFCKHGYSGLFLQYGEMVQYAFSNMQIGENTSN